MPLARIITDSVDDSLELTIQLRARGFQVETVAPGAAPNTLADLEVRLEECNPEDVLSRAAQSNTQDDLWVFVAPGAVDDRVRVIREIPVETTPVSEAKVAVPDQPKPQAVAPVIPFVAPEDEPIPSEMAASPKGAVQVERPANEERNPEKAEVVVFPAVPSRVVATDSPRIAHSEPEAIAGASADRSPASSANLMFWRVAIAAVGMAIAALLVGTNLSRQPNASPAPVVLTAPKASPAATFGPHRASNRASQKVAAKPPATTAKKVLPGAPSATPVAKAIPAKPQRRASSHADSIIAKDTVVFYDRKPGAPGNGRTQPSPKPTGRN